MKYILLTLVDVKEGCEDRVWKEMLALVPYNRTEAGCIQYDMHMNLDKDTMARNYRKIMFYENWYNFKFTGNIFGMVGAVRVVVAQVNFF